MLVVCLRRDDTAFLDVEHELERVRLAVLGVGALEDVLTYWEILPCGLLGLACWLSGLWLLLLYFFLRFLMRYSGSGSSSRALTSLLNNR